MDQRRLVKALDGDRDLLQRLRERRVGILSQRAVDAHGQERPPAFAGAGQPRASEALGVRRSRSEQRIESAGREPRVDFAADRVEIHAERAVVAGEVDEVPDPVGVDIGVDAVVLQQRNRDARYRRGFHEGERFLEHRQAAHADDRVDLAGLDDRHDERRSFRDEHGVAEPLGFVLQVLNRAQPAVLAEQAELVERRGALGFDAQALRQEQQPPLEGDAGERVAPGLVVDQHADVVAVLPIDPGAVDDLGRVLAQLVDRHRRHRLHVGDVRFHERADAIPLEPGLRNGLLRWPFLLHRQQTRQGDRSRVRHRLAVGAEAEEPVLLRESVGPVLLRHFVRRVVLAVSAAHRLELRASPRPVHDAWCRSRRAS